MSSNSIKISLLRIYTNIGTFSFKLLKVLHVVGQSLNFIDFMQGKNWSAPSHRVNRSLGVRKSANSLDEVVFEIIS